MAWEDVVHVLSLEAAADLSAKQYCLVKQDATGKLVLCGAGQAAIGALKDAPALGSQGTVVTLGVAKVICGGVVGVGANLASDAAGKAVAAGANDAVVGVALEAGVLNQIISVLMVCRISAGSRQSSILSIPIKLSKIAGAGDVVTQIVPGFPGRIQKVFFVVTDPVTTAAKAASLNLEINDANVNGGVVALTSANCTLLGAKVEGTAVAGDNVFDADDSISVEAADVTAFAEGEGVLMIVLG